MYIYNLYSGSYLSNCYVLISDGADGKNHAAVIDPSSDANEIVSFLQSKNAVIDMIIMTHGHFDHILSLDALRDMTNAPAYIHKKDAEMLTDGRKNAYTFFFGKNMKCRDAEKTLIDQDVITLGDEELKVIHLPGHSKGSISLMGQGFLVTGDTLFSEGFGRYDLYGGNEIILKNTLNKLKCLDPELKIYPGHGESAKLGIALRNISYFLN